MIITRTPFRVSLLGGGTDYPIWYRQHGGMVVGGAINRYSYIQARRLPAFHPHKSRIVYSEIETVYDHRDIRHRVVKAVFEHLGLVDEPERTFGVEVFHAADLPSRSGIGSSSTFTVGLLHALSSLIGQHLSPWELARTAIEIEQERLSETVGSQDQTFAAHGGFNVIQFQKDGGIAVYPVRISPDALADLEEHLLFYFTGVQRTSSEVAATYVPDLGSREREQWAMLRLAEEGVIAIERRDWQRLGSLIDQSWRIKAGLAEGVSPQRVSDLYAAARIAGAWGGKLTGAGGGGCLVLVAPPRCHGDIDNTLQDMGALRIPIRFEHDGSRTIFVERGAA